MDPDYPGRHPLLLKKGRQGIPVRTLVGLLLVQKLQRLSDRNVVRAAKENRYIQYFCQIPDQGLETFMNHSALCRFRQRLGVEGLEKVESLCFKAFLRLGVIETQTALIDSTVLQANILYPNDVLLIYKAFRKMALVAKAYGQAPWWDTAEIKRLWRAYNLARDPNRLEWLQQFFSRWLPAWAEFKGRFPHETDSIEFLERLQQQTDDKLAGKRHIPDRLVSLDDIDARPIKKGKKHPSCEFGTTVQLVFNRQGFLMLSQTLLGNPGDSPSYQPCLEQLAQRTGKMPRVSVTDEGYRSADNLRFKPEGLEHRFLGRSADVDEEQRAFCRSARSATEGFVSTLKHLRGMSKSLYRNLSGHRQWTLLCQIAYNLKKFWLLFEADELPQAVLEKLALHAP